MEIQNISKLDDQKFEIYFSYVDDLTDKRRRVRRRIEGSLTDAIEHRDELKRKANNGNLGKADKADRPLSQWVDDYVDHKHAKGLRPATISELEGVMSRLMETEVSDWRVEHVEAHHIDQWTSEQLRSTDLSRSTISKRQGYLKRLIKYARKSLGMSVAFIRDVDAVKGPTTRRKGRALTPEQAQRFLEGMKTRFPHHYALVFVLLSTGQRFGAVSALRWSDIDDDWITFKRSHTNGNVSEGSKTGKTIRVPLTDQISDVLDWHRQRMIREEHPNVDHPHGLVFPSMTPAGESTTNGYRTPTDLQYAFKAVCSDVGIDRITPHDLRRTFNSWAAERVNGTILRSITGHSSNEMTDHYYHGSRDAKSDVVESITTLAGGG